MYEASYNARIRNNVFVRNAPSRVASSPSGDNFPVAAVYLSEAGSDARVDTGTHSRSRATSSSTTGAASSPGRTPTGSPGHRPTRAPTLPPWSPDATVELCGTRNVVRRPRTLTTAGGRPSTCASTRTRSAFSPANLRPGCTAENLCGYSGLRRTGYPDWSPYLGEGVAGGHHPQPGQPVVVQHLRGSRGASCVVDQGTTVSWNPWRGPPYRQDPGSTTRRLTPHVAAASRLTAPAVVLRPARRRGERGRRWSRRRSGRRCRARREHRQLGAAQRHRLGPRAREVLDDRVEAAARHRHPRLHALVDDRHDLALHLRRREGPARHRLRRRPRRTCRRAACRRSRGRPSRRSPGTAAAAAATVSATVSSTSIETAAALLDPHDGGVARDRDEAGTRALERDGIRDERRLGTLPDQAGRPCGRGCCRAARRGGRRGPGRGGRR